MNIQPNYFKNEKEEATSWLHLMTEKRSPEQISMLQKAIELCLEQKSIHKTPIGETVLRQGLHMSEILASMKLDTETLCAAILYPSVEYGEVRFERINNKINKVVSKLIKGVQGMEAIRNLQSEHSDRVLTGTELEHLRKMLLAMVDDTRVVLVKLAQRVQLLRLAKDLPKAQQTTLAKETQDIYAPLANRLGVGQLKWELEDLAFRYLNPETYTELAKILAERRIDRERYINSILQKIRNELSQANIEADVAGRAKHLYSIWKKMVRKNVGFEEIYDARAIRVLVPKIADCYTVLGIVHSLWPHIPKEFDDYIATPKGNGYKSIHTAVIATESKALEVQIRTFEMHQDSEHGVAAHWRYKEDGQQSSGDQASERKIAWLRELLEWQEEVATSEQLLEQFHQNVVEDRVYVFTPEGRVVDLPPEGTPLDFAYHIHTEIGHNCVGAKVNGKMVTLTKTLQTGQTVDVMTRKNGKPSRDWLNINSGYLKSNKARQKVRHWFKKQNKQKNMEVGHSILNKELERNGLSDIDLKPVAIKMNLMNIEDLFASVGMGDLGVHQVVNVANHLFRPQRKSEHSEIKLKSSHQQSSHFKNEIMVVGIGDLLTHVAGCCKPIPGDSIIGYVTQGRGVTIHRKDCQYMIQAKNEQDQRLIEVQWSNYVNSQYEVDLFIQAFDRPGLLKDITHTLASKKVNVVNLNTHINKTREETEIHMRLELKSQHELDLIISQLEQLKQVLRVRRQH